MPRPRQFETPAERQKAYRERRAQDVDPDLPIRDIEEPDPAPDERTVEQILVLPVGASLSEREEQLLRIHFGYTASERRTRAERDTTAARITTTPEPTTLPKDIIEIWRTPADQETARRLIEAWGLEAFRTSAIHLMALGEIERVKKRKAYLDTRVPAP